MGAQQQAPGHFPLFVFLKFDLHPCPRKTMLAARLAPQETLQHEFSWREFHDLQSIIRCGTSSERHPQKNYTRQEKDRHWPGTGKKEERSSYEIDERDNRPNQ
jgi:hypothetical protein